MNYELMLLRHGKSDWDNDASDFDRPVTDRGKKGAQRIGSWLAQHNLKPDRVLSSPAVRAKYTAQKMMKAMGETDQSIFYDQRIYEADLDELLEVLAEVPRSIHRVMLVGHNPSLEQLLCYLCEEKIERTHKGKLLTTTALAHLSLSVSWDKLLGELTKKSAKLMSIQRSKQLPKTFPYPYADGRKCREQRIRPAYYYTQSSIIPYRYQQGELEILVVLSSQEKHYVVPKGIKELGMSLKESAEKEALEEAGIKGRVSAEPIGVYYYQKWQARTNVTVYAMEVTVMLDEQEWSEKHRGRHWVNADKAVQKLKEQALKPMILSLHTNTSL
ncbi:MAG: phosphohistidine phosphatase SixA [Gammaproteobacteria bacterium]|nr:phosphohistidine phosphatase SixA [Gammaproteobacteria bacterium]